MKKSSIILALLAVVTLFSCETDIEINAPYKDITVVYGLIDPAVDTQYIKINRAFLGDNAYDLAQDASNFNYPDGELAVIVEEINNGSVIKTYSTEITNANQIIRTVDEVPKDAGTFDNSTNVLFRFVEPNITPGGTYRLKIINKVLDKEITSEMLTVKNSAVTRPGTSQPLSFWQGSPNNGNYSNQDIRVTTGGNVARVDVTLVFTYWENYTNGDDSVLLSVRMPLGEELGVKPVEGGDVLEWEMKGGTFFDNIVNAVPETVPNLKYREVGFIVLEFNVAGTELSTFMAASAPSTSVNQEKAKYTNIKNGLGIFSSRSIIPWIPQAVGGNLPINVSGSTIWKLSTLGRDFCFGSSSTSNYKCN